MDFVSALEKMKEGEKIRRKDWQPGHSWFFDDEGRLVDAGGKVLNDWEILGEDAFWDWLNRRKKEIEKKVSDAFWKRILLQIHDDYVQQYVCLRKEK